jgi:ubiquinone/menaquinone biosynthesis C-methylase UbiE
MTSRPPEFERSWKKRFERFAEAHDDDASIAGWSDSGLAARMKCFVRAWHAAPQAPGRSSRWLDAGCGAGTYSRFLASSERHVTAVDYSMPTVRKARERSGEGVAWATADVTRLPFADASFDGALCFGVMQALSSPQNALRELRRVLVPGGVLWVDALNARCVTTAWSEARRRKRGQPAHLRYDEPAKFRSALRESGFESIRIHWAPIVPSRLRLLQPLVDSSIVSALLRAVPPVGVGLSHSMLLQARAA